MALGGSIEMMIPKREAGLVIGKGGAQIKAWQAATGARIQLSKECIPGTEERSVTITGDPAACEATKIMIEEKLAAGTNQPIYDGTQQAAYSDPYAAQAVYSDPYAAQAAYPSSDPNDPFAMKLDPNTGQYVYTNPAAALQAQFAMQAQYAAAGYAGYAQQPAAEEEAGGPMRTATAHTALAAASPYGDPNAMYQQAAAMPAGATMVPLDQAQVLQMIQSQGAQVVYAPGAAAAAAAQPQVMMVPDPAAAAAGVPPPQLPPGAAPVAAAAPVDPLAAAMPPGPPGCMNVPASAPAVDPAAPPPAMAGATPAPAAPTNGQPGFMTVAAPAAPPVDPAAPPAADPAAPPPAMDGATPAPAAPIDPAMPPARESAEV